MKTANIVPGEAYAYASYPNPEKVFVLTTRPRRPGGPGPALTATVGIFFRRPDDRDSDEWLFSWVRPAAIVRPWAEQAALNAADERNAAAVVAERDVRWDKNEARLEALPVGLLAALGVEVDSPQWRWLRNGSQCSISLGIDELEGLASLVTPARLTCGQEKSLGALRRRLRDVDDPREAKALRWALSALGGAE